MDEPKSRPRKKWQTPRPSCRPEDQYGFVSKVEKKILQAISARAPLQDVLNEICSALDYQIGNIVSVISTCVDRATGTDAVPRTAARFGLHVFSSVDILSGHGELLGCLEVYCCIQRRPATTELRLMEQARHLATLAIEHEADANYRADSPA